MKIRNILSHKAPGTSVIGKLLPVMFGILFGAMIIMVCIDSGSVLQKKNTLDSVLTQYSDSLMASNMDFDYDIVNNLIRNTVENVHSVSASVNTSPTDSTKQTFKVNCDFESGTNILPMDVIDYEFERVISVYN